MRCLVTSLTLLFGLLLAPSALAATTIGDVTTPPVNGSSSDSDYVFVQAAGGSGKSYTVPADGIVTSLSAQGAATSADARARLLLVRPTPGNPTAFTAVGGADVGFSSSTAFVTSTAPVRIPVKAGDLLGAHTTPSAQVGSYDATAASIRYAPRDSPPADGSSFSTTSEVNVANISVAATIEADADGDGYGDETQDSCPTISQIHEGGCTTDLRVTTTTEPATIGSGELALVTSTVTNAGPTLAPATKVTLTVPAGLTTVAASSAGEGCAGGVCAVGDIPAGQSRAVYVIVRGTAVGSASIGFAATSVLAESTPADNAASATLQVTAPAIAPLPTKLCKVPNLKGRTKAKAKAALKKAGCKAGKVRGRKGKVRTQTVPARTKVLAGTKVGFRLKG